MEQTKEKDKKEDKENDVSTRDKENVNSRSREEKERDLEKLEKEIREMKEDMKELTKMKQMKEPKEVIKEKKVRDWSMSNTSMNDDGPPMDEKLSMLQDRARDIDEFLERLNGLKSKLNKKKTTIKDIIEKKIEDNQKELKKWRDLLFLIVDESLDEKIDKLEAQENFYNGTKKDIEKVLEAYDSQQRDSDGDDGDDQSEEETEDLKIDDLLEQEVYFEIDALTPIEASEMDSRVKTDFSVLLNEPKKSLRRTFAYVGGIIRGYLRRGKSNINWIKIMRKLEGREFEDRVLSESDPYVGTKITVQDPMSLIVSHTKHDTWNSLTQLFENRNNPSVRDEFGEELVRFYDNNPEDVEFYLPQLCNTMLAQFNPPLKKFILDKCSQSIHFALQTYLLVRAAKDSREPPKKKAVIPESIVRWRILCEQLMTEIMKAVRIPVNPVKTLTSSGMQHSHSHPQENNIGVVNSNVVVTSSNNNNNISGDKEKEISTEALFKVPIQFMDNLVNISNHLPNVSSDLYSSELVKKLEKENRFLQEEFAKMGAFVYIPLLKPMGSAEYHRVIRIPAQEGYPIPTYGRVLYYTLIEVVDAPEKHGDHERDREDKKKHKKKKERKEKKERRDIDKSGTDVIPQNLQDSLKEWKDGHTDEEISMNSQITHSQSHPLPNSTPPTSTSIENLTDESNFAIPSSVSHVRSSSFRSNSSPNIITTLTQHPTPTTPTLQIPNQNQYQNQNSTNITQVSTTPTSSFNLNESKDSLNVSATGTVNDSSSGSNFGSISNIHSSPKKEREDNLHPHHQPHPHPIQLLNDREQMKEHERENFISTVSSSSEDNSEKSKHHKKTKKEKSYREDDSSSSTSGEHKKHHKKKKEKDSSGGSNGTTTVVEHGGQSPRSDSPINQLSNSTNPILTGSQNSLNSNPTNPNSENTKQLSLSSNKQLSSSTNGSNGSNITDKHHVTHTHSHSHSQSNYFEQPLGSHEAFGEFWERKAKRIKSDSPYGNQERWRLMPLIVKAGEEVLQEEFAMQLIVQFQRIFTESGTPVKLLPYRILAVSAKSGFIEPIPNSLSLDKLKKQHTNLLNFFVQAFGESSSPTFKQAQSNFVKTMAAYSVVCYLLQIKDRHNGNILLDAAGHIIHIDFGYLLSKSVTFEKAPFKLTSEFVDVMGGYKSPCYKEYCKLCVRSFLAVRKHYKKIMLLLEMTMEGKGRKLLPCLQEGQKVIDDLLARFHLDWSDEQCEKFVLELIEEARGSWRTIVYDAYQLILNNIH